MIVALNFAVHLNYLELSMKTVIKNSIFLYFMLFTIIGICQNNENSTDLTNDSLSFKGYISVHGFLSQERSLPFWLYTNTNNTIARESTYSLRTGVKKSWNVGKSGTLSTGAGLNMRDGVNNNTQIEELFATYTQNWFGLNAGVKHRDKSHLGLSIINGDILWTGNARSIPGVQLKTATPISIIEWLSFKAELGHYELNDDRIIDKARIHHKSLDITFKLSPNKQLTAGLSHYVQWAGTSAEFGEQPGGVEDFARLFFGKTGGNTRNDQINSLGNHLGSYRINYHIDLPKQELDFYHHSLFEDRSGRELNNFPDGVWGVALKLNKNPFIKTLLLEYIQTVSQSGRPRATSGGENQQSGGDNYFGNSVYVSGWTYQGNVIGLPFILRNSTNSFTTNNRSYALHAGAAGSYRRYDFSIKSTLVENLGTYSLPYEDSEIAVYTYGVLAINSKIGIFNFQAGIDVSSIVPNRVGAGVGYTYNFN